MAKPITVSPSGIFQDTVAESARRWVTETLTGAAGRSVKTQITSMNHFLAQPSAALKHIQLKLILKYSIKDSGSMNVTFRKIILNTLLLYAKGWCLQGILRCFVVFIDSFGLRFPKTSKDQFDSDSMKNYNNAVHKYATLLYSADSLSLCKWIPILNLFNGTRVTQLVKITDNPQCFTKYLILCVRVKNLFDRKRTCSKFCVLTNTQKHILNIKMTV